MSFSVFYQRAKLHNRMDWLQTATATDLACESEGQVNSELEDQEYVSFREKWSFESLYRMRSQHLPKEAECDQDSTGNSSDDDNDTEDDLRLGQHWEEDLDVDNEQVEEECLSDDTSGDEAALNSYKEYFEDGLDSVLHQLNKPRVSVLGLESNLQNRLFIMLRVCLSASRNNVENQVKSPAKPQEIAETTTEAVEESTADSSDLLFEVAIRDSASPRAVNSIGRTFDLNRLRESWRAIELENRTFFTVSAELKDLVRLSKSLESSWNEFVEMPSFPEIDDRFLFEISRSFSKVVLTDNIRDRMGLPFVASTSHLGRQSEWLQTLSAETRFQIQRIFDCIEDWFHVTFQRCNSKASIIVATNCLRQFLSQSSSSRSCEIGLSMPDESCVRWNDVAEDELLRIQENRCFGCGREIRKSFIARGFSRCRFTGRLFCRRWCFGSARAVVPALVLACCEHRLQPVSLPCWDLLSAVGHVPALDLFDMKEPPSSMQSVYSVRVNLMRLLEVCVQQKQRVPEEVVKLIGPKKSYILLCPELFSYQDVTGSLSRNLLEVLRNVEDCFRSRDRSMESAQDGNTSFLTKLLLY